MEIKDRIEVLQAQYEQGAQALRELQGQADALIARQGQIKQQMLRIEGAIAVLNEMGQTQPADLAGEVKDGSIG